MKKIVILGLGNRLMMDDGIGVYVVESLAKSGFDRSLVYEVGETDFDYCLDVVQNVEHLIVVDAAEMGKESGEISELSLSQLGLFKPGISLHHLHFLHELQLMDRNQKGILIGVEPYKIDFHWGLSEELTERFDGIVEEVKERIEEYRMREQN